MWEKRKMIVGREKEKIEIEGKSKLRVKGK